MNNQIKVFALFGTLVVLAGCASATKRGSIVMKVSDSEAHVGMGQDEVGVGDHVQIYRNVCTGGSMGKGDGGGSRSCRKESTGHGEVTQVLNNDYSIVKFPSGTPFSEGDTVEKHAH